MLSVIDKILESAKTVNFEKNEDESINLLIIPEDEEKEVSSSEGETVHEVIQSFIEDNPDYLEEESRKEFLNPTFSDSIEEEPAPLTIDNPYFLEFKSDLNKEIRKSIEHVQSGVKVMISAKIEFAINIIDAPEFSNDAKLLQPLDYAISTTAKSSISKLKGKIKEFIAKNEDGQLLLINPDKQMALDEIISEAKDDPSEDSLDSLDEDDDEEEIFPDEE